MVLLLLVLLNSGAMRCWAAGSGSSEWLIVPGQSLAKLHLGMTGHEILSTLGPPQVRRSDRFEYWSRDKQHFVIAFLRNERLAQLMFSSPKFRTLGGLNTDNFDEGVHQSDFSVFKLKSHNLNLKYKLAQGGLEFCIVNADAYSHHHRLRLGVVYSGAEPPFPVVACSSLPLSGWEKLTAVNAGERLGGGADQGKDSDCTSAMEINYPLSVPVFYGEWPRVQDTPALPAPVGIFAWQEPIMAQKGAEAAGGTELSMVIKADGAKVSVVYHVASHNATCIDQGDMQGVWKGNHANLKFKNENGTCRGAGQLILQKGKLFWKKTESSSNQDEPDDMPPEAVLDRQRK